MKTTIDPHTSFESHEDGSATISQNKFACIDAEDQIICLTPTSAHNLLTALETHLLQNRKPLGGDPHVV